jgi:uncharacterized membrane protein
MENWAPRYLGKLNSTLLMNSNDFIRKNRDLEGWESYYCGPYMICSGPADNSSYAAYYQAPRASRKCLGLGLSFPKAIEVCASHQNIAGNLPTPNTNAATILSGALGVIVFLVVVGFLVANFAGPVLGWLVVIWVLFPGLILAPLFGLIVLIAVWLVISGLEDNQRRIIREELNRQNRY